VHRSLQFSHDVAALNKMEMLRWDVWGGMPHPDAPLKGDELAFFDHLAALTSETDASFEELRRRPEPVPVPAS
jgi:hypothetical protein